MTKPMFVNKCLRYISELFRQKARDAAMLHPNLNTKQYLEYTPFDNIYSIRQNSVTSIFRFPFIIHVSLTGEVITRTV